MTQGAPGDEMSYQGHELVKACDSPFGSLPLFLPTNVTYDPETNTVVKQGQNGEEGTNMGRDEATSLSSTLHHLVKVPNAGWDMLESLDAPIGVLSCIGPYRTGKSLLVSRFLNTSSAFQIGPTLEGCTVGIWISTTALKDPTTGCYKFVLDVEGLGDPLAGDEASNARMALACLLLSSVVLFNNTSHPDRGSLQFLKCLSTIRRRLQINNNNNKNDTDSTLRHCFPSFVWVFRDFFLQLPARRDTGEPYTLQEFMMERVLQPTSPTSSTSGNAVESEVVDSLLNDFEVLRVLKVSQPKRQGQHPLSPEEMAHLGDLDWEELDESFRNDIQQVITTSLELAKPFELGHNNGAAHSSKKKWGMFSRKQDQYARGKAYAKWCEAVLELVNSTGVIPNLPDLQHQLIQQMADAQLAQCVATFETELEGYWNSCPIYNRNDSNTVELVTRHDLKAVADEKELYDRAEKLFAEQKQFLSKSGNITLPSILQSTLNALETRCIAVVVDGKENNATGVSPSLPLVASAASPTSIYARIRLANERRSHAACTALLDALYTPVQESIRNDPTSMTVQDFHTVTTKLQTSYELQARGPAKTNILTTRLLEPSKADALFVAKVTEKNNALQDSLVKQAALSKDVEQKEAQLTTLHESLEKVKEQTRRDMEALSVKHENTLQKALEEQHQREQEQRDQLKANMEQQLQKVKTQADKEREEKDAQLKQMEEQAQQRLKAEVQAREDRLKQEKEMFDKEIESLKVSADAELKEKLQVVQTKSREEHDRLEQEMTQRLEESESRLQEEIRVKEMELAKTRKDLEETKEAEEKLQQRLEKHCCPEKCVIM